MPELDSTNIVDITFGIPLKSQWEEIARPGHVIQVTKHSFNPFVTDRRDCYRVTYMHIGVHNKRAQSIETVTEVWRFLRRYKRIDS